MIPIPPALATFAAKEGVKSAVRIAKIVLPLLFLLGIAITIHILNHKLHNRTVERDALQGWQNTTVAAVAGEVPVERRKTVTAKTAVDEIHWLGKERRTLDEALTRQTNALNEAAGKATAALNDAADARKRAVEANSKAEATRQGLLRKGRTTGLTADEWSHL